MINASSLVVTWEPILPQLQGGIVVSYKVDLIQPSKRDYIIGSQIIPVGQYSAYFHGLNFSTEYFISIRGQTKVGTSNFGAGNIQIVTGKISVLRIIKKSIKSILELCKQS